MTNRLGVLWVLAALTASGSGCAVDGVPVVYVIGDDVDVGRRGVEAWSALGFNAELEDPGLPECSRTWYSDWFGPSPCQITLVIERVDGLTDDDVGGGEVLGKIDFDTRSVSVSTAVRGEQLEHVMAHEVGHVLLDAMHLESYLDQDGYDGVMSWMPTWHIEPTEDDYEMACRRIGVCVTPGGRSRPAVEQY